MKRNENKITMGAHSPTKPTKEAVAVWHSFLRKTEDKMA